MSRSVDRMPKGHGAVIPTLIPKAKVVLMPPVLEKPRVLHGAECMRLQGFPSRLLERLCEDTTDTLLKDFAGNVFSGTVYAAVLMSFILHLPDKQLSFCQRWRPDRRSAKPDDSLAEDVCLHVI